MKPTNSVLLFPSRLGWFAIAARGDCLTHLTFGQPSASVAQRAITGRLAGDFFVRRWGKSEMGTLGDRWAALAARLRAYAQGEADDFLDVPLDYDTASDFRRRVWDQCRRIPYGSTVAYAELAARAGRPDAARAVGNCMAANRIPLIVPCHRVVAAGGRLGAYSARGGIAMKRRLLRLESAK